MTDESAASAAVPMRVSVFVGVSLDGFIARENGAIDWLPHFEEGEDYGFQEFLDTVDFVVMGRNTYEQVRAADPWPYGSTSVVVLSHRPLEPPAVADAAVESMSGQPREIVARLAERGAGHLYVDGGETVQSFLREGLVQHLVITRVPVLIGSGISLFGPVPRDIPLRHLGTKSFADGLVQSVYEAGPGVGPLGLPDWDDAYRERETEALPWFNPELDADLEAALDQRGLNAGTALDLGTGPGTQAIELAKRGFEVTGTDISPAAIRSAEARARAQGVTVEWVRDDILDSGLDRRFDFIFDRGCFHVLPPDRRPDYVATIARLLVPGGHFFLKCFSSAQPGDGVPHRFTPAQINDLFGGALKVDSIKETVYQGTLEPQPRALFCVMESIG